MKSHLYSTALVLLCFAWYVLGEEDTPIETPKDLDNQYLKIFKTGNRNAASHLWTSYVLGHAPKLPHEKFYKIFRGFCSVSGSPIPDDPHTMYKTTLNRIHNGTATGVVRFCCWPCICDMNEHVRVDSKTVHAADGPKKYDWLVIGDPCKNPDKLAQSFSDPFTGMEIGLDEAAPELECTSEGKLRGATYSDSGHVIIGMFFTDPESIEAVHPVSVMGAGGLESAQKDDPTFGFASMCEMRKDQGYNSGMGLIFHLVAKITPIGTPLPLGSKKTRPTATQELVEQVDMAPQVALPPARPIMRQPAQDRLALGIMASMVTVAGLMVVVGMRTVFCASLRAESTAQE